LKKILLIGSTGHVGSAFKKKFKYKFNLLNLSRKNGFDIRKKKSFKSISKIKNIDIIINFSGQISKDQNNMKNTIINGNKNLISFVKNYKDKKILIFYISSSLVYGFTKSEVNEKSLSKPISSYAKFKSKAEKLYLASNINYNIIRLSSVYGIKNNNIFFRLIKALKENKKFKVDNMNVFRNYIHIDDFIKILTMIIKKNKNKKIYNIGSENYKISKIIRYMEIKFKKKLNLENKNKNLKKISSQKINCSKVLKEVNFKPKFKIKKYIMEL
jgi:nucleoside-diphosphate-sugar epimerase